MTGLRGSGEAAVGDLAGGLQVERPEPTSVVLSTAGSAEQASSAERKKRVPHAESWRGEAGRTQVPRSGIAGGGGRLSRFCRLQSPGSSKHYRSVAQLIGSPGHGNRLVSEIQTAEANAERASSQLPPEEKPKGVVLDFSSDPGFKLQLQSLEVKRSGIELCNSRIQDEVMHATVFVPKGKVGLFVKKFEEYAHEDTKKGKPKNRQLAESINHVRLAALESFWTDAGTFPENRDELLHWEIWVREYTNPHDVSEEFRTEAETLGIEVSPREIRFPERRVLLTRASVNQLARLASMKAHCWSSGLGWSIVDWSLFFFAFVGASHRSLADPLANDGWRRRRQKPLLVVPEFSWHHQDIVTKQVVNRWFPSSIRAFVAAAT